jgi:hypothetical protein
LEELSNDINRFVSSSDQSGLVAVINHRRMCSVLFSELAESANQLLQGSKADRLQHAQEFIARFSSLRSLHLEVQAAWPAPSIRDDPPGYARAKAKLDNQQTEFMDWFKTDFLPAMRK